MKILRIKARRTWEGRLLYRLYVNEEGSWKVASDTTYNSESEAREASAELAKKFGWHKYPNYSIKKSLQI